MGADRTRTYYEEGSTTAQHEVVEWGPLLVAPSTSKNTFNTIRRPLIVVACWRLNHALFEFDSSFVVPETKPELARLARTIDANPGCPMAIFGHADPVGDDDYNKALSGRRARALHAVLTRDVAAWEELFSSPMEGDTWGLRSTQRILRFLQRADGSGPYYVGDADGAFGAATDDAIRAFQAEHDLMVDGIAGPMTREVLYRAYMDAICLGAERRLELAAKDFIHEAGAFQGCGEFNPVYLLSKADAAAVERDERNRLNAPNRRVMVFFFEQGTVIDEADWPCPKWNAPAVGCHKALWPDADTRRKKGDEAREYRVDRRTMACRFYDRMARRSPCEGRDSVQKLLLVRLHDDRAHPIDSAVSYQTTVGGCLSPVKTAINGWVRIKLPKESCPDRIRLEWGQRRNDGTFPYAGELIVECATGDDRAQAAAKLNNIGYTVTTADLFLQAVIRFQHDYELPETGTLSDGSLPPATRDRLWAIYSEHCDATPEK